MKQEIKTINEEIKELINKQLYIKNGIIKQLKDLFFNWSNIKNE